MSVLEKLREIANQATKGPWKTMGGIYITCDEFHVADVNEHKEGALCTVRGWGYLGNKYGPKRAAEIQDANCEYIAAFNPTTVLALLDALEECTKALEYYSGDENGDASWMEPDSHVPYWTLWHNGDCVGGEFASKTLKTIEEKLKGLDAPTGQ